MQILLIIFLIFIFGLVLVFSVLRGVVSFFLGGSSGQNRQRSNSNREGTQSYSDNNPRKVFAPDEGEYVKYEELE